MSDQNSEVTLFAGTCPDEACQSFVVFKSTDQLVLCLRCGQSQPKKYILGIFVIEENCVGMKNVLRTLMLATNPNLRKGTDLVKVNGLSNYHCTLLSPLFTEYGMDKLTMKAKPLSELTSQPKFDCSLLSERCFTICHQHLTIPGFGRDTSGSDLYLHETLRKMEEANGNKEVLIPIHADGDGHCLVHAISRALTGRNLFWHPLRSHLKRHLIEERTTYELLLADFINASEWDDIINECDPEYAPDELKGEVLGLRNVHIFGLANVLKRPIILFDSWIGMQSSGDYSAVFLPALFEPDQCKTKSGEQNSPICIAWSNAGRGHFIPLVGLRGENPPAIPIGMLPEVWAVSKELLSSYMKFSPDGKVTITGKLLQEGYIQKLVKCMDELFLQKHGIHASLVCDNYQFGYTRSITPDCTPEVIISQTRRAAQEQRLYRCTDCSALNVSQILPEWLRPGNNGVIYKLAVNKYGFLTEGCKYNISEFGVFCHYDNKKDVLILDSVASQKCNYCMSTRVRLVHSDGTVVYENGDMTTTRSVSKFCRCGYKHFYFGKEYDNPPEMITVYLIWKGQAMLDEVAWFQYESDASFNSNVFQTAEMVVQKHFPGEFGTEVLVREVVDQILTSSRLADERRQKGESSSLFHTPAEEEEEKTALQGTNEASSKCDSPSVTTFIKIPEDSVVKNFADSSVMSNLQELTTETKPLDLLQEDKLFENAEKDENVSSSASIRNYTFEELRQAQLDLQAQQNEYKLKKIQEYQVKSSREKFLDILNDPDYDELVNYGPSAGDVNTWDVVSSASSSTCERTTFQPEEQPTTTVRVGPGYSVLARRGTEGKIPGHRGSRGLVPSRSGTPSQVEDVNDHSENVRPVGRSRIRGNTSVRALSRPKRRE